MIDVVEGAENAASAEYPADDKASNGSWGHWHQQEAGWRSRPPLHVDPRIVLWPHRGFLPPGWSDTKKGEWWTKKRGERRSDNEDDMGGEGEDGDEEPQEKVEEEELGEEEIDEEEHQEVDVAGTTPKKELQEKDADEEAKEKAEKQAEKDDGGHGAEVRAQNEHNSWTWRHLWQNFRL